MLVLVMTLDGKMEADQPEDECRGEKRGLEGEFAKVQGYAGGWSCDGRAWRKTDNAHLYRS